MGLVRPKVGSVSGRRLPAQFSDCEHARATAVMGAPVVVKFEHFDQQADNAALV
jgi:hypothetical protein